MKTDEPNDIQRYRKRLQDPIKAERYATRFERGPRKQIDRREQRAVKTIFTELDGCQSVLDVPSGAGRFVVCLSESNRQVIELDVAREILEFGWRRARQLDRPAWFLQADASRLPLAGGSVDAVFCNRLLHHIRSVEGRAVILRELHRVSRRYVIVSFFNYQSFAGLRRFLKALRGRKPNYVGQPTLSEFSQEIATCGFRLLKVVPTGPLWVAQQYLLLERASSIS